jgi:hypothetical protein
LNVLRTIIGPLANGHQDARHAIIFVFLALALGFNVGVDGVGDDLASTVPAPRPAADRITRPGRPRWTQPPL